MQLDHFISGSYIEQSFVQDKWLETTALATRSFPANKKYTFTGISGSQDFSLFFTLNKANNAYGNLFSNHFSGTNSGLCIAFNSNNELFVKSFGPQPFAETIRDVRLGQKNCLGIVKNNKSLTFYKYNLQGTGVSQQQTVLFPKNSNIGGHEYFIGSGNGLWNLGLSGISGSFDQMVAFSTALTKDQSLSVFSGFQPYQLTETSYYSRTHVSSGIEQAIGIPPSEADIKKFSVILNSISSSIPVYTGNLVALFTGAISFIGLATWAGSYATGSSLTCYSTGNISPTITGSKSSSTVYINPSTFSDSIYASTNTSGERLVSHLVTFNFGAQEGYFTYNLYERYNSGVSGSLSLTGDYKNNFYMEGIVTNNPSGVSLLTSVSGDKYNQIGFQAAFDRTLGLFAVNNRLTGSGSRVYWGDSGLITGYSLNSGYIDLFNMIESETYPLFYDLGSGNVNQLHTTLLNYATGQFDPETSIVFTGNSSWSDLLRTPKQDFWETCSYHLAHGKHKVFPTLPGGAYLYPNTNDFWV